MSTYTPTMDELREAWLSAEFEERDSTTSDDDLRAEFDRALAAHDAEVRASVVAEEPEAPRIITNETEANALPVGSIIRDNMGDARQKVSDRGWEQSGVVGWWGPTWVAFPAEVVWVPVKQEGAETDA